MKDPAFLFYSQDFFMGTYGMTDAQVGRYIRLMCLQHTKGHLSEDVMAGAMGGELDAAVMSKFKIDENGLYYNERLEEEVSKRKRYSESRSKNRMSKSESHDNHMNNICESHDEHMENENIVINNTTNLDKTVTKKGVVGGNKHRYGEYQNVLLTDADLEKLKAEMPDWQEMIERLSGYIESKGVKYKNHLATMRNWARKDKDNGTGRTAGNHDCPGAGPDAGAGNISEYANLPAIRC